MLVYFDLFLPSFGVVLIHERLSVRLSLYMNDMQKICSNIAPCSRPTAPFRSRSRPSASLTQTTTPLPPDEHQEPRQCLLPPRRHHVDAEEVQIVLDVDKLADSDNEDGSDFNANECLKDGHKSKHIENVRVPKGEGKHRHPLMVGAKHIEFSGNFALRLSKASGDMEAFPFISDIINEKQLECCV